MQKLNILNELRKCVEANDHHWDVWFRGVYLGHIIKDTRTGSYYIMRVIDPDCPLGRRDNYMAAIACFIDSAVKVVQEEIERSLRQALTKEPELKQIGIRYIKKKSIFQKIKGWFK